MSRLPPPRVVAAASAVRSTVQALTRRMVPAQIALLELASGFMATHAIYAAGRLRIADALANGPRTADDIAAEVGCDRDATYRLLRACATFGVFTEGSDGRFGLTPLAACLRSDTRDSLLPVILMLGDPHYQAPWCQLAHTVTTGTPAAEKVHGKSMWQFLDDNPQFAATFNDAMTQLSDMDWPTIEAAYDFSPFSTIADIGGGHGQLLALMLRASPGSTGVLLEQQALLGSAADHLREAGVVDRCRMEAGSFFHTAPTDADVYVLRRVVHDFDDEQVVEILTNLRSHMPSGATLLLMESVVPPGDTPHFSKLLDLDMMIFVGGRERTEQQFVALLSRAGFRVTRVIPTISTISLIEAVAAQ